MPRGEECASMRSMKRGGGSVHLHGTVLDIGGMNGEKRRGKYVFVVGTLG